MGDFCMTHSSNDLLAGKETSKSRGIWISVCHDNRNSVFPDDALGTREEILQKGILAASFHIYMAIAQAWRTTSLIDAVDAGNHLFGISSSIKFDIAVHRFGRRPFHDDVDRAAFLGGDDTRLASDELDYLLLRDGVGDLLLSR
jgi:hypothetical protein